MSKKEIFEWNNQIKKNIETFKYSFNEFDLEFFKKNVENTLELEAIFEVPKNIEKELLETWKVFILNWEYYYCTNETYPAQLLFLNENQARKFDKIQEIDWKIIMCNKFWKDFIIIDKEKNEIIFESKKWEIFIEIIKKGNTIRIGKKCWLIYEYNIDLNEKKFDSYKDIYEVKWWKLVNFFINKLNFKIWKLKLPEFINIEELLDTPYFWDIIAIALSDEQYRRKTFFECTQDPNFIDIYIAWWNIFTDKSEIIEEKVCLNFINLNSKINILNKITGIMKEKMKNKKDFRLFI